MTFHFRPILTIFAALGMAALIALGAWQLQRLDWKRDLIARIEARLDSPPVAFAAALDRARAGEDMEYAPVFLEGEYAHGLEARVFGLYGGEAGAYVFTPLESEAGAVYVNRGFVPQALRASETRPESLVSDPVRVEGLFRAPEHPSGLQRLLRPEPRGEDLWFVRDPALFAAAQGVDAPAYYIDSSGAENPAAWPKGGTTRIEFPNRHLEYALTWFGLAGALTAVYLAFSFRRR